MDTNDGLVNVQKYSPKIKQLPILPRISVDYPLLCRDTVAKMLAKAANNLPSDISLQIDSAYRTRRTQQILWNVRKDVMHDLVYNPAQGVPPHCTGGAVDVSLLDDHNEEINLSEPFTKYYEEPQLISNKITSKAQELRLNLNKVMLDAGFAPHPREYWHFSYGDKMWAAYYKQEPVYDEIDLPKEQYYSMYLRISYKIKRRIFKFISKLLRTKTNY